MEFHPLLVKPAKMYCGKCCDRDVKCKMTDMNTSPLPSCGLQCEDPSIELLTSMRSSVEWRVLKLVSSARLPTTFPPLVSSLQLDET